MADFSITPESVKPSAGVRLYRGFAGEAITAGSPILAGDDRRMILSDANVPARAYVEGLAVNSAGLGQPVNYVKEDPSLDLGVTVGAGDVVVLSRNAGKLCPADDLVSGDRSVVVGVGKGGTVLSFVANPLLRGAVVPV